MMLTVAVGFAQSGVPATGLTLAEIDFYLASVNKTTGAIAAIWDGSQHPTDEIPGQGVYFKLYSGDDFDTEHYFAAADYVGVEVVDSAWAGGNYGQDALDAADSTLLRDIRQIETLAGDFTLLSAILKSTSKVDGMSVPGKLVTYRTDGVTEHMRQNIVTDASAEAIASIGVAG